MYSIGQGGRDVRIVLSPRCAIMINRGLFPNMERVSGIRKFGDTEIEALRVIECPEKGRHGDQGHPAIHGLVCRRAVHLPATQGTI